MQPFLDFVAGVYSRFPETVAFFFSPEALAAPPPAPSAGSIEPDRPFGGRLELAPSTRSFKVRPALRDVRGFSAQKLLFGAASRREGPPPCLVPVGLSRHYKTKSPSSPCSPH